MDYTIKNGLLHLDDVSLERAPTTVEKQLIAKLTEAETAIVNLKGAIDDLEVLARDLSQGTDEVFKRVRGVH